MKICNLLSRWWQRSEAKTDPGTGVLRHLGSNVLKLPLVFSLMPNWKLRTTNYIVFRPVQMLKVAGV